MECEICGSRQLEKDAERETDDVKIKTYRCINCNSKIAILE